MTTVTLKDADQLDLAGCCGGAVDGGGGKEEERGGGQK